MNKKILFYLMMSVLMAGCAAGDSESLGDKPPVGATSDGKYAVGFNAYARRAVTSTRSGKTGLLDLSALEEPSGSGGGFGVFAYYTDLKRYDQTYIPNFMYNQGVFKNGANWEYTPVMYWPNEYGSDAGSDDEDKVTFFAYAPYVRHSSAASGSVPDASSGITGFSRNSTAGDPIVKYIASFDPANSVDLCWGVCADASWARIQSGGDQTMTAGLPWLDVEHPASVSQKMTFTFRHALSQLNVQIDADPDINVHDETSEIATGTKVFVRSISFTGIATHGALNLNNTVANQPLWLDYAGQTDLPYGESVTVKDGRRDGREGAEGAEATNETPSGLNPQVVQNSTTTPGVTHELQNLFNSNTLTAPVYVIPTGERVTVTIVYDVETANPSLSSYLSDGTTPGVSIENKITKDITWSAGTGLEAGKNYTLKLHLGLNSVKFDAVVAAWDESVVNGSGWLPANLATDPPVTLSLGTSMTMALSGGVGTPQTLTATTIPAGQDVTWSNTDDGVASIAPAVAPTRAGSRAPQSGIGPCSSIIITPVAAGTTVITATSAAGSAQCVVTVTDETTEEVTISLNKSETTIYATESETLVATTVPSPSTVTWVSSNTAAATVNSSGEVTALNPGLTYITATTPSGNSQTCTVTVLPTMLTLSPASLSMTVGDTETLTGTSTPLGKSVSFSSDNPSVASVDSGTGVVTAVASGTTTIRASIDGGGSATCSVTVTGSVATVATAPEANTLTYTGSAQTLVTQGVAANGTMVYATGTSSAPTSGWSATRPTATNAGDYYVWYKAQGTGGYNDSTPVKVDVSIAKKAAAISFADDALAKTTADGAFTNTLTNTGNGTVRYSISNTGSNATIDTSTGQVTSLGSMAGTATVTARVTPDANHSYAETTATYTITITVSSNVQVTTPSPLGDWGSGGSVEGQTTADKVL